ncbi:Restriction endonuclease S subunit [Halalkaliarchaeum sp. AArc-CO]|uniref:restriction endonuclease subunit S n=1 Tax=Halalkaliarchaeum sp. AArc-CO TaxID=2866381 RepID=UPI00217F10D5|nr:restriction endonuclease subunit S [Halalkaliarchaeum sp. AArc-CO]UWG50657.1 Restriction endonuclease S subunit [Halalkaliarchaeum sp. AArc-CO]
MSEEQVTLDDLDEVADEAGSSTNGWQQIEMGELAEYQNGNAFSKSEWTDDGYPIIRIQNLTGEQEEFNYFDGELEDRYRVKNGDLLLSWSATIDVFEWNGPEAALNQHIYRVDTTDQVNEIFFRFKLEELLPRLEALSHGSTMKHVRKADLVNLDADIPPLEEQRKIASVLYTVDQAIQKTEAISQQLSTLRRGLRQDIFSGQVGRRDTKSTRTGPISIEIPREWEVRPLGDFVDEFVGGATLSKDDFTEKGVSVLPKKAVNDIGIAAVDGDERQFCSEDTAQENQTNLVDSQYLITALRDLNADAPSIGRIVKISPESKYPDGDQFLLAQGVHGIKTSQKILNDYLIEVSNCGWYRRYVKSISVGSTQIHIRNDEFLDIKIPVPPLEEQQEIATRLRDIVRLQSKQNSYRDGLQRLKQGLMQDLLSGEVRTHDTDIEIVDKVLQHD